jgi:hypothetical protein
MIKIGKPPYLECSSRGDKRFSAFYAKVEREGTIRSIEEHYQRMKIFEDRSTNLYWRQAKGRKAINQGWCNTEYHTMWNTYLKQHPELLEVLKNATGLSDMFGQEGHVCQATVLWDLRNGHQKGHYRVANDWRGCCKACFPELFPKETQHICGV